MSLIFYVYLPFLILLLLCNSITITSQTSVVNYKVDSIQDNLEDPSNYLENRVDLNYDSMNALSDNANADDKTNEIDNQNTVRQEDGNGIIEKLKGVWNKILHPSNYDKATYADTLNDLHSEIFNYLNENKVPRSLQPINLVCNSSCATQNQTAQTSNTSGSAVKPISTCCSNQNQTVVPASKPPCGIVKPAPSCGTNLQNFTIDQLNYLKKFLKCMQNQQQALNNQENKETSTSDNKSTTQKCETCPTPTTVKPPSKKKSKSKSKPSSGAHSHNINEHPINHTVLDDADKKLLCSYNLYLNKLKFLAHLHHTVYQVGKKNLAPIDLNKIQALIDEAKSKLQVANESVNTCKTKDEADKTVQSDSPDVMFPFFNPYFSKRKKRNFLDKSDVDYLQLKEIVSNVDNHLRENDKNSDYGDNDYSKILGIGKTKRKGHKKKKKKKNRKKSKKHRESEDGAETAGKMPMNVNFSNSIKYFNADYNNLKFKVSPEQEEDINKFLKNINEPPQPFNFDIEQFLNPTLIERNHDPPKIKSYYEFDDAVHHPYKRKPGQIYIFNEGENDEPTPIIKPKRDLLAQRIKAISNKMRMDSFLDRPELYLDDTSKFSRSSDPYSQRYSPPLNLDQFKTDNDFIDKFYLLNDGNPNSDVVKIDKHNEVDKINPIDLRIDLDLDKKFRDLKWETDRKFYSDIMPGKTKKDADCTNDDEIKNDNQFIFYK